MKYTVEFERLRDQRQPKPSDPIVKALVNARVFEALASFAEAALAISNEDELNFTCNAIAKTLASYATPEGAKDFLATLKEHHATLQEPTKKTA